MNMYSTVPLVVVMLVCSVTAFPGGTPDEVGVCGHMTPNHTGQPQLVPSPYTVLPSETTYKPGDQIEVTVAGGGGLQIIRGFLIQARRADPDQNQNEQIGSFLTPTGGQVRQACMNHGGGSLTHTATFVPLNSTSVTVTWEAPPNLEDDIEFRVTVVQVKETFWVQIQSARLTREFEENSASITVSSMFLVTALMALNLI